MLCVSLLMQVRRFGDLAGFPCLQVLPLSGRDEDMLVEVLHNGVGLQIQPLDDLGQPATAWLNSSAAQQHVAVTALAGVPARRRTAAAR
jgi:hypothetical protein